MASYIALFAKQTTPGDTAVTCDSNGRLNVNTTGSASAALADATANPTTVSQGAFVNAYNGATWDRVRTATADAAASTGLQAAAGLGFNGATWDRLRTATADALASTGLLAAGNAVFNGATWDRVRSATGDALASTGLLAAGNAAFNGTTWDRLRSGGDNADGTATSTLGQLFALARLTAFNGTTWDRLRALADNADTVANATVGNLVALARNTLYNGTTWDRQYNQPNAVTLLTSAARTAAASSAAQVNYNHRGVMLVLFCSAKSAATTLTITLVEAVAGGVSYATGPAVTVTANKASYLVFYPGAVSTDMTAGTSVDSATSKSVVLPRNWLVTVTPSDANSVTYVLSGYLLL